MATVSGGSRGSGGTCPAAAMMAGSSVKELRPLPDSDPPASCNLLAGAERTCVRMTIIGIMCRILLTTMVVVVMCN